MYYLLLSAIALVLFYLFYKWLMSRDTLHRFNRVALLTMLLLSVALPAIHLDLGAKASEFAQMLEELVVTPGEVVETEAQLSPIGEGTLQEKSPLVQEGMWKAAFPFLIYLAGVVFFLVRLCVGLVRNLRLGKREHTVLEDGNRLVLHDGNYAPFSWMHTIVVSHEDYAANGPMILAHEREHIRLGHSWDVLLCQLCCTFQWFNPAAWLLKRELQAVHEYEADEAMLRSGTDARHYQMKLIETALGARFNSIANNFTNCSTKKRILMMLKKQTSPWARLKVLYVLPVAAVVLFAASCNNPKEEAEALDTQGPNLEMQSLNEPLIIVDYKEMSAEEFKNLNSDDINHIEVLKSEAAVSQWGSKGANGVIVVTTKKAIAAKAEETDSSDTPQEVFNVVEKMPEFEGGVANMLEYLRKNIKYPVEAIKNGAQGRVIVQFVVNKDGSIVDANVVKSVSPELDAEALRVVQSMPKWIPGEQRGEKVRVQFTLPVQFKLPKAEDK